MSKDPSADQQRWDQARQKLAEAARAALERKPK